MNFPICALKPTIVNQTNMRLCISRLEQQSRCDWTCLKVSTIFYTIVKKALRDIVYDFPVHFVSIFSAHSRLFFPACNSNHVMGSYIPIVIPYNNMLTYTKLCLFSYDKITCFRYLFLLLTQTHTHKQAHAHTQNWFKFHMYLYGCSIYYIRMM